MEEQKLRELILAKQSEGRMACRTAMAIAEEAGVPKREVGRLLDELKIKVHSCQLGCFD
ncbi:MAG: hypothetical protein V2B18_03330 [Pseudomonadota bacterium]